MKNVPATQDYIKTELKKYNLSDAKIAEMKAKYMQYSVKSLDDTLNYKVCKDAHQVVKHVRIAIEKKRKELKASSLEFGRAVDGEAKRLTAAVLEIEDHLCAQRKVIEDEEKRKREEIERKEREEVERLRLAEEQRLKNIRLEQEETARKQREAQERIEAEKEAIEHEKAKLRVEAERLIRDKKEAEERKIREEQERKDRLEHEKRLAEALERQKQGAIQLFAREAKEKIEREAKEKQEAEARAKEEAERAEALKPDIEKIETLIEQLKAFPLPELSDKKMQKVIVNVQNDMISMARKLVDYLSEYQKR